MGHILVLGASNLIHSMEKSHTTRYHVVWLFSMLWIKVWIAGNTDNSLTRAIPEHLQWRAWFSQELYCTNGYTLQPQIIIGLLR